MFHSKKKQETINESIYCNNSNTQKVNALSLFKKSGQENAVEGDVKFTPSLFVQDLEISWTQEELMIFFTFNDHKPISFEFGVPKQFPNVYIRYNSCALVIAAMKYYHGVKYKGKLLDVRSALQLKDQTQLTLQSNFCVVYFFLILFLFFRL